MAPGYWILIACIALLVIVQVVRDRRAARRIEELKTAADRMKDEFRENGTELRKYKDMCRELIEENERQRAQLAGLGVASNEASAASVGHESTHRAAHLHLENRNLVYREGLVQGKDFSEQKFVQDLRRKAEDCDVEATLLCFDSGIRMSFQCETEHDGRPILRVVLRVPEGGSCCIYEDGRSDPEEDWPPVLACLDTMFARGREVYLSYDFGHVNAGTDELL